MIRTTISICVLLGMLLLMTWLMRSGSASEPDGTRARASIALLPPGNASPREVTPPAPGRIEPNRLRPERDATGSGLRTPSDQAVPVPDSDARLLPPSTEVAPRAERSSALSPPRRESPSVSASESPAVSAPESESPAASVHRLPAIEPLRIEDAETPIPLQRRLQACLAYYHERHENVAERSPWGLMHAAIAYGVDTEFLVDGSKINGITYLCYNGSGRGQKLFRVANGDIEAPIGPGFQGHAGQFLAILAQSRVPRDYVLKIDGYDFTVQDLIEYEQRTCEPGTELTFKLIGLAHYLPTNATWENEFGRWDIPRLIKEELAQPVVGAACGGTHRLMGFTYAVRKREREGKPLEGQWSRAAKFIDSYVDYTYELQNEDGSFSTEWFAGRGNEDDIDRKMQTTGHIVEWLLVTQPKTALTEERTVRAVEFLTDLMLKYRNRDWEVGPRGHTIHALALYDEIVYGRRPGQREYVLAEHDLPSLETAPEAEEEESEATRPRRRRRVRR